MIRSLFVFAVLSVAAISTQAFVVPSIGQSALATTSTSLDASCITAKIEKRKRNRENMRKFKKGGKKGTSRKKMMRKIQSSAARQVSVFFANNFCVAAVELCIVQTM